MRAAERAFLFVDVRLSMAKVKLREVTRGSLKTIVDTSTQLKVIESYEAEIEMLEHIKNSLTND